LATCGKNLAILPLASRLAPALSRMWLVGDDHHFGRQLAIRLCAAPRAIGHKLSKSREKLRFGRPVRNYRLVGQDG